MLVVLLVSGWAIPFNASDPPWDGPDLAVGDDLSAMIKDLANATADDKIYRLLRDAQVDDLAGELAARSHLLGITAPAKEIARSYALLAQAERAPIRAAVDHWQAVTGLQEDEAYLDWNLERSEDLPIELQQAFAVLLYAISDATWLQAQATQQLTNEELLFLLDVFHQYDPASAMDNGTASEMADAYERMLDIVDRVDFSAITEAGRIMVAAVSHTSRTLERVTKEMARADEAAAPFTDGLAGFYEGLTPDRLDRMGSGEKLTVLIDYLRMVADASGHHVVDPAARTPPASSLTDGLVDYARSMGLAPETVLGPKHVLDAEMLPDRLQGSLAHLLAAHAAVSRSTQAMQEGLTDPQTAGTMYLESVVGLVAAIRDVYPTLSIYGHLYGFAGPQYSKQLADQPAVVHDVSRVVRYMGDSSTPLHGVTASVGSLNGVPLALPAQDFDLSRGSLGRAVLSLYDHVGAEYDAETASQIENGTAQLPVAVEQAASRVLQAQLLAQRMIEDEWDSWTPQQRHWLLNDSAEPASAFMKPAWGYEDEAILAEFFQAAAANRLVTLNAAMVVTQAVEDSRRQLDLYLSAPAMSASASGPSSPDDEAPDAPDEPDGPDSDPFSGPGMSSQSSSSSVPASCVSIPFVSDCQNFDAMFIDPVLRWVMITASGSTDFDPNRIAPFNDGRDQMLTIDLGGNDRYLNGQASVGHQTGPIQNRPILTAVSVDMGGDDEYLAPPHPFASDDIQGAARQGVALLLDQRGDDKYETGPSSASSFSAPGLAQGAATLGFGALIDESGNDAYFTRIGVSQGASPGWVFATTSGGPGGAGILLDREDGTALGADRYRTVAPDRHAQGMTGVLSSGILIDSAGSDEYLNGGQGRVIRHSTHVIVSPTQTGPLGVPAPIGLAVLADLAGDDSYTRKTPVTGNTASDGQCFTGLAVEFDPETLGQPTLADDDGNFAPGWDHGMTRSEEVVSVFLDFQDGSCTVRSPLILFGGSEIEPDELLGLLDEPPDVSDPAGFLAGVVADSDQDGWPDMAEELVGTSTTDADEYPAGLPGATGGSVEPVGSPFLVEVPYLFGVGDVTTTRFEKDFVVSLDLGGGDVYTNHVGSALDDTGGGVVKGAPCFFVCVDGLDDTSPSGMHIDVGSDSDIYDGPARSQAHGGILIDFGGDDRYTAGSRSQGSMHQDLRAGIALLADLGGNDEYSAGTQSQGFAKAWNPNLAINDQIKWGLFFDFIGDDVYDTPGQGTVITDGGDVPRFIHGAFHDLSGKDSYTVDDQGRYSGGIPSEIAGLITHWAHFADLDGADEYIARTSGADRSRWMNQRSDISAILSARTATSFLNIATRFDLSSTHLADELQNQEPSTNPNAFEFHLPSMGVAIGNRDATRYEKAMALTVDLGGDDLYLNNAGGSVLTPAAAGIVAPDTGAAALAILNSNTGVSSTNYQNDPRILAALAVDTRGNDRYDDRNWLTPDSDALHYADQDRLPTYGEHPVRVPPIPQQPPGVPPEVGAPRPVPPAPRDLVRAVSQGAGFLGVGMLVDQEGDDAFSSFRLSQGAGVVGIGLLWDRAGDDRYQVDTNVVRSPAASDGRVVWMDHRNGRWDLYSAQLGDIRASGDQITDITDDGARGDHVEPTIDGQRLVWSANFGRGWDLYWSDPANDRTNMLETLHPGRPEFRAGDQRSPLLVDDAVAYFDIQPDGQAVVLQRNLDSVTPPEPVVISSDLGSPKEGLDFGGDRISWSQWNESTARWEIVVFDMVTKAETVVSPERAAGDRVRPRLGGERPSGFVAWAEKNPDPVHGWDVLGYDFQKKTTFTIAAGSGDQRDHDANQHGVVYIDSTSSPAALMFWFISSGETCLARDAEGAASMPAFDSDRVFDAYFVRTPEVVSGSPEPADVEMRPMNNCQQRFPKTDSATFVQPRFLQGAALQQGLGLLLEEGGQDDYRARDFSQGSAFTTARPPLDPMTTGPPGNQGTPTEIGARGILLDLDGHDEYAARDFSQGSHGTGINVLTIGGGQVPAVFSYALADHQGVLIDVRGNDHYEARGRSQGFAGLAFGGSVVCVGLQCEGWVPLLESNNGNDILDAAIMPILVNSVGILLDTGGVDAYVYGDVQLLLPTLSGNIDQSCEATLPGFGFPDTPEPVPDTGEPVPDEGEPVTACVDPLDNLVESVLSALSIAVGEAQSSFDDVFDPDPATRNNQVWRQSSMGRGIVGDTARPTAVHPGGLGADVGAYDKYAEFAQAVLEEFVSLQIDVDQTGPNPGPQGFQDTIRLSAEASNPDGGSFDDNQLRIESVEYFAESDEQGTRFLGFGSDPDCNHCFDWFTDDWSWPDGSYNISARATLAPAASGTTIGYVDSEKVPVDIDNAPRIRDFVVTPAAFSPEPSPAVDDGDPSSTLIAFNVSRDFDETIGRLRVDLVTSSGSFVERLHQVGLVDETRRPETRFSRVWDGRLADGSAPPPGRYAIRIEVSDDPGQPLRATPMTFPIVIDGDDPDATCVFVAGSGCGGQEFLARHEVTPKLVGDDVVGVVPVFWSPGSNKGLELIRTYHVFFCSGPSAGCPDDDWTHIELPGSAGTARNFDISHGQWLDVTVIAEDVFGNVERGRRPDGTLRQDVTEAFEAKRADGDVLSVQVDLIPPSLETVAVVGGESLPSTTPVLISRSSPGHVEATIGEATTNPIQAELFLFNSDQEIVHLPLGALQPDPASAGRFLVSSQEWRDHIPEDWPGGTLPYLFQARDLAGNTNEVIGILFLDPDKPDIVETAVLYPSGKTFVEQGEVFQVVVRPSDPCRPICSPIQSLHVSMDASAVNATLGTAGFKFKPPKHYVLDVRVDSEPADPTILSFPLAVADLADNVRESSVHVHVGEPIFGIEVSSVQPSHDSIAIQWTTETPTYGRIEYGTTSALGSVVEEQPRDLQTEHEIQLTGLAGSTNYFFRIVAENEEGLVEKGPLDALETTSGLEVTLLTPTTVEAAFGEPLVVRWEGFLLSDETALLDYEVAIRPESSPGALVLASVEGAGQGPQQFLVDPADFSDGRYELLVTVLHDDETETVASPTVLFDRRKPNVLPLQPAPGSVVTASPADVAVRITDAMSGVDAASVELRINGIPVTQPAEAGNDGAFVFSTVALSPGHNVVSVSASDAANNLAARHWDVTLDVHAPTVTSVDIRLPDGKRVARPGDEVAIDVRVEDASGVRRVWAETKNASWIADLALERAAANRYAGSLFIDGDEFDFTEPWFNLTIPVWAEDTNGHRLAEPVLTNITMDGISPHVVDRQASALDLRSVTVSLNTSEPVRLVPSVSNGIVKNLGSLNGWSVAHTFEVAHLGPPGRLVNVTLRMQDEAGNVAQEGIEVPTRVASDLLPPDAPTGLVGSASGAGRINLAWTAADDDIGVAEYRIWRTTGNQGPFASAGTTSETAYHDQAPPTDRVTYYVTAIDFAGRESMPSNVVTTSPKFPTELTSPKASPSVGTTLTEFRFRVDYVDPTGGSPDSVRLVLDGVPHEMEPVGSGDVCSQGCEYGVSLRLPTVTARDGAVWYHVEAYHGAEVVRSPLGTGEHRGPIVLDEQGSAADESPSGRQAGPVAAVPAPPPVLAILLVVTILFYQTRSRRI